MAGVVDGGDEITAVTIVEAWRTPSIGPIVLLAERIARECKPVPSVIEQFAESVRTKSVEVTGGLFAEDVRLYGVAWKPFEGKDAVLAVFAMLQEVLDDLEYVAEYEGPEGLALQVRGRVGGREFDGVQLLTFNNDGLIEECLDLIRPHSAGTALLEASEEYLARQAGR